MTASETTAISLSLHDELPPEAELIDAGLGAANEAAAPLQEVQRLACIARTADGTVIGGAVGRNWGECCELQQLWVEPSHRRRGLGARLVLAFEARAQQRGCRTFYLETFSFQAPRLYRSLGYEVRLEIAGFGAGIAKYSMVKLLGSGSAEVP
jgi:ribosomal protein S18 acetylase RimI-like enzyme